jgi:pyruvate dehydrogenase E2 component (dihydrolipoamide acetyltransferase)
VPVLKHANTYNLSKLTENTRALIQRARSGKLGPDELSGSTFSISNVGMFGITSFSPIINPPEAGILGVCAIEQLPRFKDGVLVERSIMTLSLTFDHRIVDGAESAQFLQTVKDLLEKPLQLLV